VASGILGLAVEDPHILQHSACGLLAYPQALLAAEAAINTKGNDGLWLGGEEYSLHLSCASCRFCVMYRGGIPVSESSTVECPYTCMVVLSDLLRLSCSVLRCVSSDM